MFFFLLIKGITLGLTIAAPVGPIGVLCIRRTLTQGRLAGLLSGLGAASADAMYGCVAAFGFTVISSFLLSFKYLISMVGGILLCYIGLKILFTRTPIIDQTSIRPKGLAATYFSTLFLTLTNPMTILCFMAIFASVGRVGINDSSTPGILVTGIFLGSALWWLILSTGISLFRSNISPLSLKLINMTSGAVITFFGMMTFFKL